MACCDIKDTDSTNGDNIKIRGCTDVLFLCIFILFLFVMVSSQNIVLNGANLSNITPYWSLTKICLGLSWQDKVPPFQFKGNKSY